jgi:hypothetical protein
VWAYRRHGIPLLLLVMLYGRRRHRLVRLRHSCGLLLWARRRTPLRLGHWLVGRHDRRHICHMRSLRLLRVSRARHARCHASLLLAHVLIL